MSTIIASNVSDGTLSIPTTYVTNGSAKAWVNFNGTGTIAARDSFNVTSLTDNGTGVYAVNFATALANANYSWSGLAGTPGVVNGFHILGTPTTSSVPLVTLNTSGSLSDFSFVVSTVHGDIT